MILGMPVFGASAPTLRVQGRKISNGWANLETLWMGIGDSLYGFRVYPIEPLREVMRGRALDAPLRLRSRGRGAAVLARRAPDQPARAGEVPAAEEGGVSHFNYLRDNILLTWMHLRLMPGFPAAPAGSTATALEHSPVKPTCKVHPIRPLKGACPDPPHPLCYASEQERRGFVGKLFHRTASDYDRIDRLLALGTGPWYRNEALQRGGETRYAHRRHRCRHRTGGARSGATVAIPPWWWASAPASA